jgi:hypothetical protein
VKSVGSMGLRDVPIFTAKGAFKNLTGNCTIELGALRSFDQPAKPPSPLKATSVLDIQIASS